jgi:hypothetical protein
MTRLQPSAGNDSNGAWNLIDRYARRTPARNVREFLRRVSGAGRPERLGLRSTLAAHDLAAILAAISAADAEATIWVVLAMRPGEPEILFLGRRGEAASAVIRIARTKHGRSGLARELDALESLHIALAGIPAHGGLIPTILGHGDLDGAAWLAERAVRGRSGRKPLGNPAQRRLVLEATAAAIDQIHKATARARVVGDPEIRHWVGDRVGIIEDIDSSGSPRVSGIDSLATIASSVARELQGRSVTTSWIHGDLWPANVLIDERGGIGIIDWDSAEPDELPLQDQLHLTITSRRIVEHKDLGTVVSELLRGAPWTADDRIALASPAGAGSSWYGVPIDDPSGAPSKTALWLYWLRFVESNLARHPELSADGAWVAANVERVLLCA